MNTEDNRQLHKELEYYLLFKEGFSSKTEDGDWLIKLEENNNLSLTSTNTSIDLSKSSIIEFQKLNNKQIEFDFHGIIETFKIKRSIVVNQSFSPKRTTIAQIDEMINVNYTYEKQYNFRTIIPYNKKIQEITFIYYFAHFIDDKTQRMCTAVNYDGKLMSINGVSFSCNGNEYIVYNYDNNSKKYIVIENISRLKYDDYICVSNKILNVIGFFTTIYSFGPYMIFDTKAEEPTLIAYNNCLIMPRKAKYKMLTLNAYAYFADNEIKQNYNVFEDENCDDFENEKRKLENNLKPIKKAHFEKLLSLLYDKYFSNMFDVLRQVSTNSIEGNSSSPIVNLILYATCLELATKWFEINYKNEQNEQNEQMSLLSPETRKKIILAFCEILDNYTNEKEEDIKIIKNKIKGGIFNLPNYDKLSKPFNKFGVRLTEEDKRVLNIRNKILHGNYIIAEQFNIDNILPYLSEVEYYCFGFYSLLWRLIMKIIGFDGKYYLDEVTMNNKFRSNKSNNGKPFIKEI